MTTLIDTLLSEHKQIFSLLDSLQKNGHTSDAGGACLAQLRQLIVGHLGREDSRLYPALAAHQSTRAMAAEYQEEMKAISREVKNFFDHAKAIKDPLEFSRSLGRMVARLRARMTREEIRLYPAYRSAE